MRKSQYQMCSFIMLRIGSFVCKVRRPNMCSHPITLPSPPKTNTPNIPFKQIQKSAAKQIQISFKQNTKTNEKSGLSRRKDQTQSLSAACFCNHCFGQKGWFVNTFVDCMIAKIIPPAARWAMHAASDPQPNAADSAIEKIKLFRFVQSLLLPP